VFLVGAAFLFHVPKTWNDLNRSRSKVSSAPSICVGGRVRINVSRHTQVGVPEQLLYEFQVVELPGFANGHDLERFRVL